MLTKRKKQALIKKYQTKKSDTGSPEVQIAILTEEVKELTKHLQIHKKDHSSRRGLLRKLGQRRRLLRYLGREDEKRFNKLVKNLNLKGTDSLIEHDDEEDMPGAKTAKKK